MCVCVCVCTHLALFIESHAMNGYRRVIKCQCTVIFPTGALERIRIANLAYRDGSWHITDVLSPLHC